LLLIFGVAALLVFCAGDVRRIERGRFLDISTCRVSTTPDGPADWPFFAEFRSEA